jgi:hypothetical protein
MPEGTVEECKADTAENSNVTAEPMLDQPARDGVNNASQQPLKNLKNKGKRKRDSSPSASYVMILNVFIYRIEF